MSKLIYPNFVRFFPNFRQFKTFGVTLAPPEPPAPKLLDLSRVKRCQCLTNRLGATLVLAVSLNNKVNLHMSTHFIVLIKKIRVAFKRDHALNAVLFLNKGKKCK